MTLRDLEQVLAGACPETYRLAAPQGLQRFVVYLETPPLRIFGDNRTVEAIPTAAVHICTNNPEDTLVGAVCAALDDAQLPYSFAASGYNEDRNLLQTSLNVVVI